MIGYVLVLRPDLRESTILPVPRKHDRDKINQINAFLTTGDHPKEFMSPVQLTKYFIGKVS